MATPLFFGHCSEALVLEVANVGDFLGPNSWGMGMWSSCKGSGLHPHRVLAEGFVADGVRPVMTRDQQGLYSGARNGVALSWDSRSPTRCLSKFRARLSISGPISRGFEPLCVALEPSRSPGATRVGEMGEPCPVT